MYTAVYSAKAGVGVTATAALLAMASAARAEPALLIDLGGDQPAALGIEQPDGPGVVQWATTPGRSDEALDRISVEAAPDLAVAPRGDGAFPVTAAPLCGALSRHRARVFVDVGRAVDPFGTEVVERAARRLLVVRYCYLSLRAAAADRLEPTGVIVLAERDRALGRGDVESVIDAPVLATVAIDPAVARAVDAGLLRSRPPRRLLRAMASVATDAD